MVAKSGDLVADALEGVAEPTAVDDKATSDGGALGLVADKLYIHNFLGLFKTIIVNLDVNYCQFKESILLFFVSVVVVDADEGASEGEYLSEGNEDGMMNLA